MSDGKHLLDDLIQREKSSVDAPDAAREQTWSAIEASLASGASPPLDLPPAATPSVLATSSLKAVWWIAGVAVLAVGGATLVRDVPPPPVAPVRAASPMLASTTTVPVVRREEPPVTPAPVTKRRPPNRVINRPAKKVPEQDLTAEVTILRRAQLAMKNDDAPAALEALDEHQRRFPKGAIVEEQHALRVHVLCALERRKAARDAAARFARDYPKSPQLERVRRACAGTTRP